MEGIGYDFIPQVLDRSLIDIWYKSNDIDSLVTMRKLIREEGLLCGGSSGAAVSCALVAAAQLREDQTCVIILPDSVRNYMTKALSDEWMVHNGFVDGDMIKPRDFQTWWASKRVCDLPLSTPLTITADVTCKDAISLLKDEGFDMVPVLQDGCVIGVVTEGNISSQLLSGRAEANHSVADAGVIYKKFRKFSMNDTLADLARALDTEPYALIVTEQRCFSGSVKRSRHDSEDVADTDSSTTNPSVVVNHHHHTAATTPTNGGSSSAQSKRVVTRTVVSGIVTRIDLLDYVSSRMAEGETPATA